MSPTPGEHDEPDLRRPPDAALARAGALEVRLRELERLANLGTLAAEVVHEVRNPLHLVGSFAQLSRGLLGELDEELRAGRAASAAELLADLRLNLSKIHEHALRADRIVRGILDHARGEVGEPEPIDLDAMVEAQLALSLEAAAGVARLRVESALATGARRVSGHAAGLAQAVRNLLENALHALEQRAGAQPDFEPVLEVATRDLGRALELRVRDNGVGIPPDALERVFTPFFSTKARGHGTGLGLAIAHEVVTKGHGGELTVSSEAGRFTELRMRLPALG